MKAVIFAGGVGTRLWPLSRKKSPKQFEKMIDQKSTLQLTVERMRPEFKPEDIFISTGSQYVDTIRKQLPFLPKENILGEPYKKEDGLNFYSFEGFKYKPSKGLANKYFNDNKHCWNLGYFISTPHFIRDM